MVPGSSVVGKLPVGAVSDEVPARATASNTVGGVPGQYVVGSFPVGAVGAAFAQAATVHASLDATMGPFGLDATGLSGSRLSVDGSAIRLGQRPVIIVRHQRRRATVAAQIGPIGVDATAKILPVVKAEVAVEIAPIGAAGRLSTIAFPARHCSAVVTIPAIMVDATAVVRCRARSMTAIGAITSSAEAIVRDDEEELLMLLLAA